MSVNKCNAAHISDHLCVYICNVSLSVEAERLPNTSVSCGMSVNKCNAAHISGHVCMYVDNVSMPVASYPIPSVHYCKSIIN